MRISTKKLQQLTIYTTVLTGAGVGTMYFLMQKRFLSSEFHRSAVQKLEQSPEAMQSLGAPPLKVHNIHLSDRHNHINHQRAQLKIPVTGTKTGGYLYTSSQRDPDTNSWSLKLAVLKLREGGVIDLLAPPPSPSTEDSLDTDAWH